MKTCFIVTPIGSKTDPIRRHIDGVTDVIRDAIGSIFEVNVAHEMYKIGSINRQVMEQIYTSDLVIANLTNLNPNVMYELAFRHSVGKPAIIIAEAGTKLPFDVKDERTFEYINDYSGIKALGETLQCCVATIDFDDTTPRGPIHGMILGFLLEQRAPTNASEEMLKAILHRLDRIEQLDKLARLSDTPGFKPGLIFELTFSEAMEAHGRPDLINNSELKAKFYRYKNFVDLKLKEPIRAQRDFLNSLPSKFSKESP